MRQESDYRETGKPDTGYRGLHIVVVRQARLVEVQLRTGGQHYWAEQVERTSSFIGHNLKDGDGPAELLDSFKVASDLTWQRENGTALDKNRQPLCRSCARTSDRTSVATPHARVESVSTLHFLLIYDHEQQKLLDALDLGTKGSSQNNSEE